MADLRLNGILSPPVGAGLTRIANPQGDSSSESFADALNSALGEGLKFSKHAKARLESRSISLEGGDLQRLSNAVDRAAGKGIQDSLVLLNQVAYIVSVPDKTVVTAMPVDEANVFTNIDGAVIA